MSPFFFPIVYTSVLPCSYSNLKVVEITKELLKCSESCTDHQYLLSTSFTIPYIRLNADSAVLRVEFRSECVHLCAHLGSSLLCSISSIFHSIQKIITESSQKTGFGGIMSSTTGQIKKTKEQLQKLRREFLQLAADPQMQAQIAARIKYHKQLLAELGGTE